MNVDLDPTHPAPRPFPLADALRVPTATQSHPQQLIYKVGAHPKAAPPKKSPVNFFWLFCFKRNANASWQKLES